MKRFTFKQLMAMEMACCALNACDTSNEDDSGGNGSGGNGSGGNGGSNDQGTVAQNITSPTTWDNRFGDPSKVDYVVENDIDVNADLTIKPGVKVQMPEDGSIIVTGQGSLNAEGTSDEPIIFTGKVPTKGYWRGISVNSPSDKNKLNHVTLEYGGSSVHWWDGKSILWAKSDNNTKISIKNTTFAESSQVGFYFGKNVTLTNFSSNNFKNNKKAGLWVRASNLGQIDSDTDYNNGNGEPHVRVYCDKVNADQTWKNIEAPYLLSNSDNDLNINANVTIEAGADFLAAKELSILVNQNGAINAEGTSGDKITFKGNLETHGHWRGIKIASPSSSNVFKHVEFAHGGKRVHWWDGESVVWVASKNNGSLTFKNCEVHTNKDWGLTVNQSSGATITPSTKSELTNQNNFHDNGLASSPKCSGDCHVNLN